MPRSRKPVSRQQGLIQTIVHDAMNRAIALRDANGRARYAEAFQGIGVRYKYKDPELLRGKDNIRIRLQNALVEINREIIEKVVEEFKGLVIDAKAVARGAGDPESLLNALEVVQDSKKPFNYRILVVNRVWLYQEYGFDMKGKMPPRDVAERILQWAIDKGIVMVLRSRMDASRDKQGKIKYKYAIKQRQSKYYERVDYDMVEVEDLQSDTNMEQFMWYITGLVVKNNSGRNNRRLFLTTAYYNVISDKAWIRDVERKWFKKYRVISK